MFANLLNNVKAFSNQYNPMVGISGPMTYGNPKHESDFIAPEGAIAINMAINRIQNAIKPGYGMSRNMWETISHARAGVIQNEKINAEVRAKMTEEELKEEDEKPKNIFGSIFGIATVVAGTAVDTDYDPMEEFHKVNGKYSSEKKKEEVLVKASGKGETLSLDNLSEEELVTMLETVNSVLKARADAPKSSKEVDEVVEAIGENVVSFSTDHFDSLVTKLMILREEAARQAKAAEETVSKAEKAADDTITDVVVKAEVVKGDPASKESLEKLVTAKGNSRKAK